VLWLIGGKLSDVGVLGVLDGVSDSAASNHYAIRSVLGTGPAEEHGLTLPRSSCIPLLLRLQEINQYVESLNQVAREDILIQSR
jgi:hypothetical protein